MVTEPRKKGLDGDPDHLLIVHDQDVPYRFVAHEQPPFSLFAASLTGPGREDRFNPCPGVAGRSIITYKRNGSRMFPKGISDGWFM
jgi:hypothetical protein